MRRFVTIVYVILALFLTVGLGWAEKAEPPVVTGDYAPVIGPVAFPGSDSPWDVLFSSNIQASTGNQLFLGCAYAGGFFLCTSGGVSSTVTTDNLIYRFTSTGALVDSFAQPDVGSGFGLRDLAWDGTYLYGGSEGSQILAFTPSGQFVPGMNITKPAGVAIVRALAYDPIHDHFWTGNYGADLVEFDRAGTIIWQGASGPLGGVYGMAWDSDPQGPWLWIYDQSGTPGTTFYKFNPTTHTLTNEAHTIPILAGSGNTDQAAGGCEMSNAWNPTFWSMVAIAQGTPNDYLYTLEIRYNVAPLAPAMPTNFSIANNGTALTATLHWTNPTTTFNGQPLTSITSIKVRRNDVEVASLNGTPGQVMTYNDNVPSIGTYNYIVYAVNGVGNGAPAMGQAWIGLDYPSAPTNVVATSTIQLQADLTWTAPTVGLHGGYFPPGSWTGQKIYRNNVLIATLSGTNTSYTDILQFSGTYTYGVAYYNTTGQGPTAFASPVLVQGPQPPPWYIATLGTYNWVEINPNHPGGLPGTNSGLNSDDQTVGPFPLGFNFPYYSGVPFSSVRMCSNGFASFTSSLTSYSNLAIPNTTAPRNLLAPYWDDLIMTTQGTAWYYSDIANDRFIMEWDSVAHYNVTGFAVTDEIILHADGTIDYMYKNVTLGGVGTPSATVGIQDTTGTVGVQCTYNNSGPMEPVTHYAIHFGTPGGTQWDVVTMVPVSPPVVIPAQGGSFQFNCAVRDNGPTQLAFAVWARIKYPNGTWTNPVLGPVTINPPVNVVVQRSRTQNVPGTWPAGDYLYYGYTAQVYPGPISDSLGFGFTKSATVTGAPGVNDAFCYGELFPGEVASWMPSAATEFALKEAYPNPFNPITTIGFTLPQAGKVTLNVYDVSGRQVASVINGWREAGAHQATFDGSSLASGIYLYRLTMSGYTAVRKMVLIK